MFAASGVVAALCMASSLSAAQPVAQPVAHPHATLSLISASETWKPGEELLLAFNLDIESGWHTYWQGISDSGQPPQFQLSLPDGFTAKPAQWPAPRRMVTSVVDALDHIYEDHLTVVVPIETPKPGTPQAAANTARFVASGVWLVCKGSCIPEKGEASIELSRGDGSPHSKLASRIFESLARCGRAWSAAPSGAAISHSLQSGRASCTITIPGATFLAFYPDQHCLPMPRLFKEGETKGPTLSLSLSPQDDPQATGVLGLLEVHGPGDTPRFYTINEPVIVPASAKATDSPGPHK